MARGSAGAGTGPIWLDNLKCTGSEAALSQCQHSPWGIHNCWCGAHACQACTVLCGGVFDRPGLGMRHHGMPACPPTRPCIAARPPTARHSDDVAISCGAGNDTPLLRLVNGTARMGRLEIRFNGQYGTVSFRRAAVVLVEDMPLFGWKARRGGTISAVLCPRRAGRQRASRLLAGLARFTLIPGMQVCSDEFGRIFDNVAAAVACRQMGQPLPALAIRGAVFGAGK